MKQDSSRRPGRIAGDSADDRRLWSHTSPSDGDSLRYSHESSIRRRRNADRIASGAKSHSYRYSRAVGCPDRNHSTDTGPERLRPCPDTGPFSVAVGRSLAGMRLHH